MSTWIYLHCASHDPKLKADGESGQHAYDLPDIRQDIRNRDAIVHFMSEMEYDIEFDHHFRGNTAHFLKLHPKCKIEIWDQYGRQYDLDGESLEPIGKNLPKSMVPQGAVILVTKDNHQWAAETSGHSLDFVRGAWDSAIEQDVVCTIQVL